jgi:alpha-glucosidase
VNVAAEIGQADSLLTLYQRLIALRRAEPALSVGEIALLPTSGNLIAHMRKAGDRRLLIVLNLGAKPEYFNLGELLSTAQLLLSTASDREKTRFNGTFELRANEGVITELL